MKQVTIECINITKSFKNGETEIEVLHGIDLTMFENELIMLMGPSGSGKTTLISIIGGILQPDSGTCSLIGQDINALSGEQKTIFRGTNVGFLFQHFTLVPTLTAEENAAIPLLCLGYSRLPSFKKARTLIDSMGLQGQYKKKPQQLSGGEQQRVAIARAFIHNPKVLLCDEPTSFLDIERGKKVMQILQDYKVNNSCTIIVVTHDVRILPFADRVIYIDDGRIREEILEQREATI